MKPKTAEFLLTKVMGWTIGSKFPDVDKALILGVPHTSILDFVVTALYARSQNVTVKVLVKEKFFFWPLKGLLEKFGAMPLKSRENGGTSAAMQMIEAFESHEKIFMAFAPEGTRSPVKRWKKGFHTIATAANVPVYAGFFDWGRKTISCGEYFPLTDDARTDLLRLQQHYKDKGVSGRHPEKLAFDDSIK